MTNYRDLERRLSETLELRRRPVAVVFRASPPPGVAKFVGNRVYTDLDEDELYVAICGADLSRVVGELGTIAAANATLAGYHRERRLALAKE